jgi:DNA-binding NarL/FixJ family response regulator
VTAPARVLLADDHEPTRAEVAALVDADPRLEVVAAVADAPGAVRAALDLRPDACVLDVHMPGGGLVAAWEIAARLPRTRIVMLTVCDEDAQLLLALRAGAAGYLLKTMDPRRVAPALHDVLEGRSAIPRHLMPSVLDGLRDRSARRRDLAGEPLTSREWEVLEQLRRGRSTRQVADDLVVTPATVRFHVMAVVRKLGVASRDEALALFDRA